MVEQPTRKSHLPNDAPKAHCQSANENMADQKVAQMHSLFKGLGVATITSSALRSTSAQHSLYEVKFHYSEPAIGNGSNVRRRESLPPMSACQTAP